MTEENVETGELKAQLEETHEHVQHAPDGRLVALGASGETVIYLARFVL